MMRPRADWRPGLRKYPFGVRSMGAGAAWREDVYYAFSAAQIDQIESVADELHTLIRQGVRLAIEERSLTRIGVPPEMVRDIELSWIDHWHAGHWRDKAGGLVGRLTLAYDGRDSLKLLACDYDCPSGLFAASVIQKNWREMQAKESGQFNGLHDALVERWEEIRASHTTSLHLACYTPDPLREGELVYLAATAEEAGIATHLAPMQRIVWDGRRYAGPDGSTIQWLYKQYPWEDLSRAAIGKGLRNRGLSVIEPVWRWVPSLHGFLALLWQSFPDHPHLCRAGLSADGADQIERATVRSSLGLDHAASWLVENGQVVSAGQDIEAGAPLVWIETPTVFSANDRFAVIDAWIVGDKCQGMCVREADSPIVGPESNIVPHIYRE